MAPTIRTIGFLAATGLVAIALCAAPIGLGSDLMPHGTAAFAKGKGSGNSGGRGGGHGGRGGGHGASSDSDFEKFGDNGKANGAAAFDDDDAGGKGKGRTKNDAGAFGDEEDLSTGEKASALGNLNAAHASPTALEHASENSIVGMLGAYAKAVDDHTLDSEDDQRTALGAISNKAEYDSSLGADAVDAEVVNEVNSLLGVPSDTP